MNKVSITSILRIVILMLVLGWCFYIIRPFLVVLVGALIISVALEPLYSKLVRFIGVQRKKLGTFLFGLIAAIVLLVPAYLIVDSLVKSIKTTIDKVQSGTVVIPEPKESVKEWPLVGEDIYREWKGISNNFETYVADHGDVFLDIGSKLIGGVTGFLAALLILFLACLISLVFMFHAKNGYEASLKLFGKLMGPKESEEIVTISRDTIRGVVRGILLVAVIQAIFGFIGYRIIDMPASGLWALGILVTSAIQLPTIIITLPSVIVAFTFLSPTHGVIFAVYILIVTFADAILKPIFLGQGLKTPMVVILIGTLGGLILHGIVGLFVGPVVLAVAYQLYQHWLNFPEPVE